MTEKTLTGRLHEQMHKLPGLPDHGEAARLNHRDGLQNGAPRNRPPRNRARGNHSHPYREPRVLVGWQNAIARFFSGESSRDGR